MDALRTLCMLSMGLGAVPDGLLAHWPLKNDVSDVSGNSVALVSHEVMFREGAASFDGTGAYLEAADAAALALDADDFTICARIYTDSALTDSVGDIASKLDPSARTGFTLGIQCFPGVTSAQPNHRHLQFGVDAGTEGRWTDCGRPGNAVFIMALCTYEGALYAGVCEPGEGEAGHVYRYGGPGNWVDCGSPDSSNAVCAFAEYNGALYAGTGRYRLKGSALPESPNQTPGGSVFRYKGGTEWENCGRLGDACTVIGMAAYGDGLYATPAYHKGVYRYRGGEEWAFCGIPGDVPGPMFEPKDGGETPGCRLISLGVHNGHLFGAGNGIDQGVFRYEGDTAWSNAGVLSNVHQVYSFMAYQGALYCGTWPNSEVFRLDRNGEWSSAGRLGEEKESMAMIVYNGNLYAGSLPAGEVFRYDGGLDWSSVGRIDETPDVMYRRVWSMAVHNGKMFAGTLPSGRVWSYETGQCVTWDHALPSGWRHVAAVRHGNRLELFLDGKQVAESPLGEEPALNIACGAPFRLGVGAHDFFLGRMRDVRVYGRALAESEVSALAAK